MSSEKSHPHAEMLLSEVEWCELYYAACEYGDRSPDDLIGIDGQDGCEGVLSAPVLEGFISNLRSKQRSIEMGEYGEDMPELRDAEWLRILRTAERKLSSWLELKNASEEPRRLK